MIGGSDHVTDSTTVDESGVDYYHDSPVVDQLTGQDIHILSTFFNTIIFTHDFILDFTRNV